MTIARRIAVLIGLTPVVVVGASLPASAAFAGRMTAPTALTATSSTNVESSTSSSVTGPGLNETTTSC
jgi:hypothetical protein